MTLRSPVSRLAAIAVALAAAIAARPVFADSSDPEDEASHHEDEASHHEDEAKGAEPRPSSRDELVQAAPPPFSEGVFPCSQCHDGTGDRTRRELGFHEEIQQRFEHNRTRRWCLDCHDMEKRDLLHLSSGERIPFTESYALCAQCHYDKYRDWRLGIHGKRVGSWEGQKTYLLCVNCHDPHSPRIKPIRPERRPRRPAETRS